MLKPALKSVPAGSSGAVGFALGRGVFHGLGRHPKNDFFPKLVAIVFIALAMIVPASAQDDIPPGPGKDDVVAVCSGCHGLGQVVSQHKSADQWSDTVTRMVNNGAHVPDDKFDVIVSYLATNFGPGDAAAPAAPASASH